MLKEQIYRPLLALYGRAGVVRDNALVTYYTGNRYQLARLEREIEELGRALEGVRLALQAVRSRGGDPMEESHG